MKQEGKQRIQLLQINWHSRHHTMPPEWWYLANATIWTDHLQPDRDSSDLDPMAAARDLSVATSSTSPACILFRMVSTTLSIAFGSSKVESMIAWKRQKQLEAWAATQENPHCHDTTTQHAFILLLSNADASTVAPSAPIPFPDACVATHITKHDRSRA
jgi:hypothetical protein